MLYLAYHDRKGKINMTEWVQKQYLVAAMAGICLIYFFVKWRLRHAYGRLLKETGDMGHSNHKLLKNVVTKFNACYQLKMGIPNVSVFVEKYLRHYRLMGVHLKTWENFTGVCVVLIMAVSMGGSIWAMMGELPGRIVFLQLFAGVIGTGVLLLTDYLWNTENQWELLVVDITDYLENMCKPRLENEVFHPVDMQKYRQEYFDEDEQKVVNLVPKEKDAVTAEDISFTPEEERVIREVIQEYLG